MWLEWSRRWLLNTPRSWPASKAPPGELQQNSNCRQIRRYKMRCFLISQIIGKWTLCFQTHLRKLQCNIQMCKWVRVIYLIYLSGLEKVHLLSGGASRGLLRRAEENRRTTRVEEISSSSYCFGSFLGNISGIAFQPETIFNVLNYTKVNNCNRRFI